MGGRTGAGSDRRQEVRSLGQVGSRGSSGGRAVQNQGGRGPCVRRGGPNEDSGGGSLPTAGASRTAEYPHQGRGSLDFVARGRRTQRADCFLTGGCGSGPSATAENRCGS